jgi:hypothetical protein
MLAGRYVARSGEVHGRQVGQQDADRVGAVVIGLVGLGHLAGAVGPDEDVRGPCDHGQRDEAEEARREIVPHVAFQARGKPARRSLGVGGAIPKKDFARTTYNFVLRRKCFQPTPVNSIVYDARTFSEPQIGPGAIKKRVAGCFW